MKKVAFVLLWVAVPLMMLASPVGQEKAWQIASQFLNNRMLARTKDKPAVPEQRQLVCKDMGFRHLWVVADEANGGFVIVAGDDNTEPVLGYSETDFFDEGMLPTPLQMLLQSYDQQVGTLVANAKSQTTTAVTEREPIAPLIKTVWHQYLPFRYLCPFDENAGNYTAVGCVALVLAQLMYYYQYPQGTTQEIPAYTTGTGYDMPALPPTTFDYSKMHLNYDYCYSTTEFDPEDESVKAVTKLLLYCGCALQMNYSTLGSAAVFDPEIIAKYFGFDRGCRYLMAGNYPHDVWEEMVYNELKAGRPLSYSAGAVGNQNHQFLVDGYDGYGFFHVNIGEIGRGSSNSYFRLGVINDCDNQTGLVEFSGYNVNQAAMFGFQPDKGNNPVPVVSVDYGDYSLAKSDFTRNSTSSDFQGVILQASMKRWNQNGLTMDCGWGLFQYGVLKKVLCSISSDQEMTSLGETFAFGNGLADGTYQIYPIFRNHGAAEWEHYIEYHYYTDDMVPMVHYTATIQQNNLHLGISSKDPNVTVDKVEYYAPYTGAKLNARAFITNGGTNYENYLFFWIDGQLRTGVGAYVDPGKSDYVDFCTAAPEKGSHKVSVSTDEEGKEVIYTGTLDVTDEPVCQLTSEVTIQGMDENHDVHHRLDVTCKITNTGSTTFNNMVYAEIQSYASNEKGEICDDIPNGLPTWPWRRVWYLHLEPGESQEISFSINHTVMKPNDYFYAIAIDYYNYNYLERLYGWGYFKYYEEALDTKEGDANGDDSVDAEDIMEMMNGIMDPSILLNKSAADINGDGVINAADIIALMNIIWTSGNVHD
jgi:hypothetical protein